MFKIGVGPSSSHTVGPMIAALKFRGGIGTKPPSETDLRLQVELFGSLSLTGRGHSTDAAVCAGLAGLHPTHNEPEEIWASKSHLIDSPWIELNGLKIAFNPTSDILWKQWTIDNKPLPHPNTMAPGLVQTKTLGAGTFFPLTVSGGMILFCLVLITSFGPWAMPQMVQKFYSIRSRSDVTRAMTIATIFALFMNQSQIKVFIPPVKLVPNDGVANGSQMNPNLVLASGMRPDPQQREISFSALE